MHHANSKSSIQLSVSIERCGATVGTTTSQFGVADEISTVHRKHCSGNKGARWRAQEQYSACHVSLLTHAADRMFCQQGRRGAPTLKHVCGHLGGKYSG
eukprot:1183258-Prorocentrum_minimum.AAC.1